MELRRTLIMLALATVSYFIFLAWQQDYAKTTNSTVEVVSNQAVDTAALNLPTVTSSTDLPQSVTTPNAITVETTAVTQGLIHVKTDVFNIKLDPQGGDIVYVDLPQYTQTVNSTDPFVLMNNTQQLQYIAQSGVIGANGSVGIDDNPAGRPTYRSQQANYTLAENQNSLDVVLVTETEAGLQVRKVFTFMRGEYLVGVRYELNNQGQAPWQGALFGQIKRDNSIDPSSENHSFGMVTFLGGAWWNPESNYNKVALDKFGSERVSDTVPGGWAAMVQHYFVSAWVPQADVNNHISTRKSPDGQFNFIGFTSSPVTLKPGEAVSLKAGFYAGPKVQDHLAAISPGLELTVDYGWLWPIAQFLFWLLQTIHEFLGNWGWSIVVLTILVKAAFYKLSAASYRSMANMRRVMPELQRMKEQFGDDRQKMSQAMMALYKKEKINPLGGCLPILVQMPVFIALYWTLMESVELRHADWILWIDDLSLMDPYFILPLLMGATMFIQQQLNPAPQDPIQAKMLKFMPIIFTVFFLWFPAGLVLYWLMNNVLSIAQQWYITRAIEREAEAKKA